MEERIRFVTAITPSYAHAWQSVSLGACPTFLDSIFVSLKPKPDIHTFLMYGPRLLKEVPIFRAIDTYGGTRCIDGETQAGW